MKFRAKGYGQFSHEQALLIGLLTKYVNPQNVTNVSELTKKQIDWNLLFQLAEANCVVRQVWVGLNGCLANLPNDAIIKFYNYSQNVIAHHVLHFKELKRILGLFEKHEISVMPFKGPLLGHLYGNDFMRQWQDLDFIVHKEDLQKVIDVLTANEYRLQTKRRHFSTHLDRDHSIEFYRNDLCIGIDVHWALCDPDENIPFSMEQLWMESMDGTYLGHKCIVMSSENLIFTTIIHHVLRNNCNELRQVVDIALLLTRSNQDDWHRVILRARELGLQRAVLTAISLAEDLFQIPVTFQIKRQIQPDRAIEKIRGNIISQLLSDRKSKTNELLKKLWNRIKLRESMKIKAVLYINFFVFVSKLAVMPNFQDKRVISLNKNWQWVYFIIRPFRLLLWKLRNVKTF